MVILLAKDGDYGDYSGAGIPQVLRNLFDTVSPQWAHGGLYRLDWGVRVSVSWIREVSLVEEICRG